MKVIIIGYSNDADQLLRRLDLRKHEVILIEKDPQKAEKAQAEFDIMVIKRDATDPTIYTEEINIGNIDVVIALTGNDVVNLFVLTIAKLYKVPYRLAKFSDPAVADLVMKLELGFPLLESSIIANTLENYVESFTARVLGEVGEWKVYSIVIAENDKAARLKIGELGLPENTKVLLIFDGYGFRVPKEDDIINPGYQLIVLSKGEDIVNYFKG